MPAIYLIMNSISQTPVETAPQPTSAVSGRLRQNIDKDQGFAQTFAGSQSQPDAQAETNEMQQTSQQALSEKSPQEDASIPDVTASTQTSAAKPSSKDDDAVIVPLEGQQEPVAAETTKSETPEKTFVQTPEGNDPAFVQEQKADNDTAPAINEPAGISGAKTEDLQAYAEKAEPEAQISQSDGGMSAKTTDTHINVNADNSDLSVSEAKLSTVAPDPHPDSGIEDASAPLVTAVGTAVTAEGKPAASGSQALADDKLAAATVLTASQTETIDPTDLPDHAAPKQANDNVDTDILKNDNAPKGPAIDAAKTPLPNTSAPQIFDMPASTAQTSVHSGEASLKTSQMIAALPQTSTSAHVLQSVTQNILQAQFTQSGLSIRLDPPEMGNVTIQFQFGSDGDVTAIIKSDVPETSSILRERADILQQSLKDSGFSSVNLSFEQNNNSNSAQRHYQPLAEEGRTALFNAGDFLEEQPAAQPSLQKQISAGRQIDIKL